MTFVPCSPKHKSCSKSHADLVNGYRLERHRQEVLWEGETGGHAGDAEHRKAKGHTMIDFKVWLTSNKQH